MPRIPDCDRCCFCAHDHHLVCAAHPDGPNSDTCLDFEPDPTLKGMRYTNFLGLQQQQRLEPEAGLWEPEGASYYNGELILQPQQRWTREEQLELLDTHPLFNGKCPACNRQFLQSEKPPLHWDCECGWIDDTV